MSTVIFIYDNGRMYSDHALYFIQEDKRDRDSVERLLNRIAAANSSNRTTAGVAAVVETIEWRKADATMSLNEFLEGDFDFEYYANSSWIAELKLGAEFLEALPPYCRELLQRPSSEVGW